MPVHDWTRVPVGIVHDFHHSLSIRLSTFLNKECLRPDYYALIEPDAGDSETGISDLKDVSLEEEFYRRKQKAIGIRHASGDRLVAMVEIVSPANKSHQESFKAFVDKAADLLDRRISLLLLDLSPRDPRDPRGIHGAIWEKLTGEVLMARADKPLTLAAYESRRAIRAFVEPVAVGDVLPEMPLFLEYGAYVNVPLEATYRSAFDAVPRRWREVLESAS